MFQQKQPVHNKHNCSYYFTYIFIEGHKIGRKSEKKPKSYDHFYTPQKEPRRKQAKFITVPRFIFYIYNICCDILNKSYNILDKGYSLLNRRGNCKKFTTRPARSIPLAPCCSAAPCSVALCATMLWELLILRFHVPHPSLSAVACTPRYKMADHPWFLKKKVK